MQKLSCALVISASSNPLPQAPSLDTKTSLPCLLALFMKHLLLDITPPNTFSHRLKNPVTSDFDDHSNRREFGLLIVDRNFINSQESWKPLYCTKSLFYSIHLFFTVFFTRCNILNDYCQWYVVLLLFVHVYVTENMGGYRNYWFSADQKIIIFDQPHYLIKNIDYSGKILKIYDHCSPKGPKIKYMGKTRDSKSLKWQFSWNIS